MYTFAQFHHKIGTIGAGRAEAIADFRAEREKKMQRKRHAAIG
jgi:hypothetical protein